MPRAQLIFTDIPGELPADYVLPPGMDLEISSVYAAIDGAAAAGSFRPCLTVLSQAGNVIARVPLDETYAVADTGDATWSPFLRTAAASSAGGTGGEYAYFRRTTNLVLNSGSAALPFFSGVTSFASNSAIIDVNTDATWGGTFEVKAKGIYLGIAAAAFTTTFAAQKKAVMRFDMGSVVQFLNPGRNEYDTAISDSEISASGMALITNIASGTPPGANTVTPYFQQFSGVARTIDTAGAVLVRLVAI